MDISNDQDTDTITNEANESITPKFITRSLKPDQEPVDMNILFGKPAEPVIEHKNEIPNKLREEDPDIEAIFTDEPVSLVLAAVNQYDDDYTADYQPQEKSEQTPSVQKDAASEETNSRVDDVLSGRAVLILNRLKKLSPEYLEAQPNGITKVLAIGLKNTKLDLKDCVTVLKSAGLLVLVDGYETGLGSPNKSKSRYFLVKADLLDGK